MSYLEPQDWLEFKSEAEYLAEKKKWTEYGRKLAVEVLSKLEKEKSKS